jgi:hypothetical protein
MMMLTTEPEETGSVLRDKLVRHGLGHYEESLHANGFDDWETVTAITESDMAEMGFSLGDRRKLQQAISRAVIPPASQSSTTSEFGPSSERIKRRYRKHPQADPNAPTRPKTAYVRFGEHLRNDPTLKGLSFTEYAKETGKRWQHIMPFERYNTWEKPAAEELQRYKSEVETYEKTEEYRDHQAYLTQFYAAHPPPNLDSGTSETTETGPTETEPTTSTLSPIEEPGRTLKTEVSELDLYDFDVPQDSSMPPIEAGMEEIMHVFEALGVGARFSRVKPFPPERNTSAAVQTFINNTGSLLYLWEKDEVTQLLVDVYHSKSGPTQLQVVELLAMAAIGSYCDGETSTSNVEPSFMDAFVYSLHTRTSFDHLRAMRLFTCLAICRFTNRATSARKLMCW